MKLACNFDVQLQWLPTHQKTVATPSSGLLVAFYLLNWNYDDMNLYRIITDGENTGHQSARLDSIKQIEAQAENLPSESEDVDDDGVESELFSYYVDVVSKRKAFGDSQFNEFKFLVVPNSIVSPALYQSVIALAAHDMKSKNPDKSKYYARLRGKYKHGAINLLYKILDDEPDFISSQSSSGLDEVVTTILMLCSLEISNQGNRNWISHLRESGLIFGLLTSDKVVLSELLLFAYRYFSLRYILLLTTLDRPELDVFLSSTPWPLYEQYYDDDAVDYLLGCSPRLLFLIYEITILRRDIASESRDIIAQRYHDLWAKLTSLKQTLNENDKDSDQLYRCSQAYLAATKLFFADSFESIVTSYWPTYRLFSIPDIAGLQVSLLAMLESLVRRAHLLTLFPTWCLFMSAILLNRESHRMLILNIFAQLQTHWPLGSPITIRSAIELIWKMNDLSLTKIEWTEVLSTCNYMLALT